MSTMPHDPSAIRDLDLAASISAPKVEDTGAEPDFTGFKVEATDGPLGKVGSATVDTSGGTIVVETGPWLFGKKLSVAHRLVDRIDWAAEVVYLSCSKAELEHADDSTA